MNTTCSILRAVYSIYVTWTRHTSLKLRFLRQPTVTTLHSTGERFSEALTRLGHVKGQSEACSRYAQSMFLRDGSGSTIFSTGQHAVEAALIRGGRWAWVVVTYTCSTLQHGGVGVTARNHEADSSKHSSSEKTLRCGRTRIDFTISKASNSLKYVLIFSSYHHNEHNGLPLRSTDQCYLQK
jgi:hypothetical protein